MNRSSRHGHHPRPPATTKTSRLAIASVVCGILFLCPAMTILAIVLGAIAMKRIKREPALSGTGVALTGIVLGVMFTFGQVMAGWLSYQHVHRMVWYGPYHAIEAGYRGDLDGFRRDFTVEANAQITDEQIEAFIDALRDRYGNLADSERLSELDVFFQSEAPAKARYRLIFEQGTAEALAPMIFVDEDSRSGVPMVQMKQLTVTDPDPARGVLTIPPAPADAATDQQEASP